MDALSVIERPEVAALALDPTRAAILRLLAEPRSPSELAGPLGLARQRVNYHVRALEAAGLVGLVEERARRGLTERVYRASAAAYLVTPTVLGDTGPDPARMDRLSADYLLALGARLIREIATMTSRARTAGKSLPTLAIDTEIRFATPADRVAFTEELADAVLALVARHHDESTPGGRTFRVLLAAHPLPTPPTTERPHD